MLVTKLEKNGTASLTDREAIDLPILYQAELSSLAVARSTILDRYLVSYLEALSLRAYLVIYGPRTSLLELAGQFLKEGLPRAFWTLRYHILISFLLMLLSVLTGYIAIAADNLKYPLFIPPELAQGRDFSASSDS